MALSVEKLAKAFECSPQTVRGYVRRGMPTSSVKKAHEWVSQNVNKNIGQPTQGERAKGQTRSRDIDELEIDELREKIRKLAAEADAKELKNAQVRGELYNAADVERNVAELTGLIRVRLESIPDEIEMDIAPEQRAQLKQRWIEKVRLILTEMSQFRLTCDDDAATGEGELQAETAGEDAQVEL